MTHINDYLNKIHLGDCMDILRQLPDKSVDLVLTDPPYGINMAKTINCISKKSKAAGFIKKDLHTKKEWDNTRPDFEYFEEMIRVSKNQIIFGGNYFADFLPVSRGWIVWDKKEHPNQGNNFADCELAYTSFNKNIKKYTFGWVGLDYINNRGDDYKIHPTQKPRQLFEMILRDYSKPGDIILDPFSGSATTAVACHNLGRQFICIEKDPEYHAASVKRLEQAQKTQFLF